MFGLTPHDWRLIGAFALVECIIAVGVVYFASWRTEARVEARRSEWIGEMVAAVRPELDRVLEATERRAQEAKAEVEAMVQEAQASASASAMGQRSGEVRRELAMQEAMLEAALDERVFPGAGVVARTMVPSKLWRLAAQLPVEQAIAGPLAGLVAKLKGKAPGGSDAHGGGKW